MTEAEGTLGVRRILVALDASSDSMAALEVAVQLAVEFRAELVGLFVEDSNLLNMADLPVTREVGSYTAVSRDLDRAAMERQLRALRAAAERALAHAAEHARLRYSFRVSRGSVHVEVLKAATEVDLVTLGHLGWASCGRRGVGSTARLVLGQGVVPVLLAQHALQAGSPVFVVYDGTPAARHGLAFAARLAAAMDGGITVLTPGDRVSSPDRLAGEAARLADEAADHLRLRRLKASHHMVPVEDPGQIAAVARAGHAGALVMPFGAEWLPVETVQEITGALRCPVLVVRAVAAAPAAVAPADTQPAA